MTRRRQPGLPITAQEVAQAIATAAGGLVGDESSGLVTPEIASMAPYSPRPSWRAQAQALGLAEDEVLLMAANENPLGPSEKAIEAAHRAIAGANQFGDGSQGQLREALAARHGVSPEQIVVGNGSSEIVELLVRAFMGPGQTMVTAWPSFVVYRLAVQAAGREGLIAPLRNHRYDLAALAALVDTRTQLVFIANPNNPTGTYVPRRELAAFLDRIPRTVVVVLDEAYAELVDADDHVDGVREFGHRPRLVVLRTFSKAFGLAGLRVGYGVMDPLLVRYLDAVRQPFNVSAVGQAAALAALEDEAHLRASRRLVLEGRAQLREGLRRLGVDALQSQTNFLTVDLGPRAPKVVEDLRARGVFVRHLAPDALPNMARVTIGTKAQNIAFLGALGEVLADA